MPPKKTVITEVVNNNYCVGCGMCVGICPSNTLEMTTSTVGEVVPQDVHDSCIEKCNMCLSVCPFGTQSYSEDRIAASLFAENDNINFSAMAGYYLNTYSGYSNQNKQRAMGSSGGLATWLLTTLLENGAVDYVINVTPSSESNALFTYQIAGTVEEIQNGAKSAYCQVDLAEIVDYIKHNEAKYAFIGLPCYIKTMRLVAELSPKIRQRVKLYMGLVCGQTQSRMFSEYLTMKNGGDPENIESISFRNKNIEGDAKDFTVKITCAQTQLEFPWAEQAGYVWARKYFTPNACQFCDDAIAELADVVFLDAWVDEYIEDARGMNFVLVRNPEVDALLKTGEQAGSIILREEPLQRLLESQALVLQNKKVALAERLHTALRTKKQVPAKRITPKEICFLKRIRIRAEESTSRIAKKMFTFSKNMHSLVIFQVSLFFVNKWVGLLYRLENKACGNDDSR